jgi:hypothetical protein
LQIRLQLGMIHPNRTIYFAIHASGELQLRCDDVKALG